MQPHTVYLDMANWIALAEGHVDSTPFEKAIADTYIVPVLGLPHLLELASNANTGGRKLVASYMDSVDQLASIKWIKHYWDVIRREAISCFKEMFGGNWEPPVTFFRSFHETMPDADRATIMTVGEGMPRSISEMVDILVDLNEFREYRTDCLDYPDLRQRIVSIRSARGAAKRFTDIELRTWLAELLPERVDMSFGPVEIQDDMRKKFVESVDISKCPAFRANWAFHEGSNLDHATATQSDIPDLWHLTGVAYCDLAFADKRTIEALRKGNYDKMPTGNSGFKGWAQSLGPVG
ncbi:MAG: hypothetical protein F4123_03560 [Gemmatimonadetes bacterium]|nr:hypothetical protein [Gemmatimonadota bacterium]MYB97076.1 hypothetical protein [Gemmatimonadota bacterium]MYI45463.1 hypothetical protein [Gemmatimonadota bacterium]